MSEPVIQQRMVSVAKALPVRSYKTTVDYCAYPVASMEAESLVLPETLPAGVGL